MEEQDVRKIIQEEIQKIISEELNDYTFKEYDVEQCMEKLIQFGEDWFDRIGLSRTSQRDMDDKDNKTMQIYRGFKGIEKYVKKNSSRIAKYINDNKILGASK